ncbi:MAG: NADH-quinone oxidoreductase subunit G [Sorangiineae bacterium NIC37A_2]|jgi:NADH-quinone oxidoreductase subunit G|nr:MAG: NADH-quinone oxidoreductase subunit G [Sorangiineae bacterium NIC37A_2]
MPKFKLDDYEIEFSPGETVIQAAERAGRSIPHYCWHPGLSVAANCRMCLVEVMPPPGRPALSLDVLRFDEKKGDYVKAKKPKLQPACQLAASDGMEIKSDTSEHVIEARAAVQEFLLLNHPVDCPICDQAGECRLQDYWLDHSGRSKRMRDEIIHKPKAVDFGPTIVYDAERCIVCTRCVRFCEEVVGDPVLDKRERGNLGEIVLAPGRKLDHAYTLMTEYVCPVGALTAKDFRFKARVWFLKSVKSICVGCATGCNSYTDFDPRDQTVYRYRPRENAAVNRYWMCDEGMLDYQRIRERRILRARVQSDPGASATDALHKAAALLKGPGLAVLLSAEHSSEDNVSVLELGKALGAEQFFMTGRPNGEGDNILRNADKNPNRRGILNLLPTVSSLAALEKAVEAGQVTRVLALGSAVDGSADFLRKVPVVALSVHDGPIAQAARVTLPAASWAEAQGTFTNAAGLSQVSEKAVNPPGDAQPGWRWALHLAGALGVSLPFTKGSEVRARVQPRPSTAPSAQA